MADPDLQLIDRYLEVLWQYQASDLLVTADRYRPTSHCPKFWAKKRCG